MNTYIVEKYRLSSEEIRGVVAIHRKEIGQGFLSSLGDKALSLLFSLASESKFGVLLVAKDTAQARPVGFLLGATDIGAFYKDFLIKKSFKAIIVLVPRLFSFETICKIVETLLYPTKNTVQCLPKAELLDIAILRKHQGTGLAQLLFHEFSITMRAIGIREFKITTGKSLIRAQRFYEQLGAKKVAEIEVHKGQITFVYTYQIPSFEDNNQNKILPR